MRLDIFKTRMLDGKSSDEVRKLLGELDKKQTVEGREDWLYRTDNSYNQPLPYFPVSFDSKRGAFVGRISGDTLSISTEE
jgi:hypothetical protein